MASPAPAPIRIRKLKTRRQRPFVLRFWWVGLVAIAVPFGVLLVKSRLPQPRRVQDVPGYIASVETLEQEYQKFQGKPLKDNEIRKQFQRAAELASTGEYNGAVLILEPLSKAAAVPVVF